MCFFLDIPFSMQQLEEVCTFQTPRSTAYTQEAIRVVLFLLLYATHLGARTWCENSTHACNAARGIIQTCTIKIELLQYALDIAGYRLEKIALQHWLHKTRTGKVYFSNPTSKKLCSEHATVHWLQSLRLARQPMWRCQFSTASWRSYGACLQQRMNSEQKRLHHFRLHRGRVQFPVHPKSRAHQAPSCEIDGWDARTLGKICQ